MLGAVYSRRLVLNMSSKRKDTESGPGNDPAVKKKKLDCSLFGEVLSESGFVINFSDEPYTLETDQALFQRRLLKALRSHPVHCHPASTKEFLRCLDAHLSDSTHLKWALLYTQTGASAAAARAGHQDSLLRLLLNIDELQTPLLTLLTEKLLELAYSVGSDEDRSLPRLILANLQRLDRLADAPAVADKMLQLLQCAPPEAQKEVISFLPEIVDDCSHAKIADELCKLYYSTPELALSILEALPSLDLTQETLVEVKHSVQKTVQAAQPDHLPVVVKFLLEDAGKAEELVEDLRQRIRLVPSSADPASQAAAAGTSDDSVNHEVALLHNIKSAFLMDRRQHLSWLKALDRIASPEDHHPLDVLLLLQLHDTTPARQRLVEAVLKKKVRSGMFTRAVLQQTFTAHAQTLKQFVPTLRHLASFLLRCSDPALSGYGSELYRLGFVSFCGYQQQAVVTGLLSHASDQSPVRQTVLQLLQKLADDNTAALARYSAFLKGWLDLLDQLTLAEARQLMSVLCTLAFKAPEQATGVADEIQMLLHKQLSNPAARYKRLGIVGVLMAVRCRQDGGESTSSSGVGVPDDSQSSEVVLTSAAQRETAQLLRTAQAAVVGAPDARGLLLDELASLVWRSGLDPKIEHWICDQMMDEFQETFVIDMPEGVPECEQLQLALKYGLEEEGTGEIALNLTPLLLQSPEAVPALCTQFRLLRMCVASLEGGAMEKLDALLGCPVILPADDVIDSFSQLSTRLRHLVLTSLFYCVNFFRELLNAFSTQKDQELKRRCVLRLRAVLQLEAQLRRCLPLAPGFVPPAALFDCDSQPAPPAARAAKKGKPAPKRKGKAKSAAKSPDVTANQSAISQLETSPTQERTNGEPGEVELAGYRPFMRELDMDVYKLLYRRFSLTEDTTEEFCVRPLELQLLLEDLTLKLERRLSPPPAGALAALHAAASARGLGFSHLDLLSETSVAKQAVTLLKPLSVIGDTIVGMFKSQIADNDGLLDGPGMFGAEVSLLADCLSAVYRIMGVLLSWRPLAEPEHRQLANEAMANLRISESGRSQPASSQAPQPAGRAFALLRQHAAHLPRIEGAANLARLLSALAQLSGEAPLREALADCVESLLRREWYCAPGQRQSGAGFAGRVDSLLRLMLSAPRSRLERLDRLCREALPELQESPAGRDAAAESFPTLTRATFGHYYRGMFAALVESIRAVAVSDEQQLETWATALHVFNTLVSCLKTFHLRSAIGVCLKHSRRLVEMFVKHAIPTLELMLKHQKAEVLTILKNFQVSARYLHHVCNHSKLLKDASLMNHVPLLKKGLESFVFRVKAMLALNGCSGAFWMGNLKNRDLQGDEILSQSQQVTDSDGEDEEGAEEEEQSDVDLDAEEERSSSPDRDGAAANDDPEKHDSEISEAY